MRFLFTFWRKKEEQKKKIYDSAKELQKVYILIICILVGLFYLILFSYSFFFSLSLSVSCFFIWFRSLAIALSLSLSLAHFVSFALYLSVSHSLLLVWWFGGLVQLRCWMKVRREESYGAQSSATRRPSSKNALKKRQQDENTNKKTESRRKREKWRKNVRGCYFFFFFVFLFKNANILKLTSFINLRVCAMHADIYLFLTSVLILMFWNCLYLWFFFLFIRSCFYIGFVEHRHNDGAMLLLLLLLCVYHTYIYFFLALFFFFFCYSAHMNGGYNVHTW